MKNQILTSPKNCSFILCGSCCKNPATIECQECGTSTEYRYFCYNCDTKCHSHSYKAAHKRQVLNYKNLDQKLNSNIIPPIGPKPIVRKISEQIPDENSCRNSEMYFFLKFSIKPIVILQKRKKHKISNQ